MEFLDEFIKSLLHIDDLRGNRLLDVGSFGADGSDKAYRLFSPDGNNSRAMLNVIKARRGKPSNKTALSGSALVKATAESAAEKWDWTDLSGKKDVIALDNFITAAYNALDLKGNNPLFLGVGCLNWSVAHGDEVRSVNSPLLIFPIRLVRGTNTSPVEIEFVDDDAQLNPCLIARMHNDLTQAVAQSFPHPNGENADIDEPVDLDRLGDGVEYMQRVKQYVSSLSADGGMTFDGDIITVAQYNHSDICMYYDVRRNKQKIYSHPLVGRVFGGGRPFKCEQLREASVKPVLPIDSVQQKIIERVAAGESLIIKGPPGTGKTLTIANMLATLLAQGKSVLVASEKLSALAEVYKKLPESLRKFVMLLDYETEQKAAAVDPAVVRAQFKKLIQNKREYVYDSGNDIRFSRAERAKADAVLALAGHSADMFSDDVAWGSYYDAIDAYYKCANLPVIEFTDSASAAAVSREDHNKLILAVKQCSAHCQRLGDIGKSPWRGVSDGVDVERAIAALGEISSAMKVIVDKARALSDKCGVDVCGCSYGDIHDGALPNALSGDDIVRVLGKPDVVADGEKLSQAIDGVRRTATGDIERFVFADDCALGDVEGLCGIDGIDKLCGLSVSKVRAVANHADLFLKGLSDAAAQKFTQIVQDIAELKAERAALDAEVMFVFDRTDGVDIKDCEAVMGYADGDRQSVRLFDIKARAAQRRLRGRCLRADISLTELAKAAAMLVDMDKCDGKISGLTAVLTHVVGADELTPQTAENIITVAEQCAQSGMSINEFVTACVNAAQAIDRCKGIYDAPDGHSIESLIAAAKHKCAEMELKSVMSAVCDRCGIALSSDVMQQALSVSALVRIYNSPQFKGDANAVVKFVDALNGEVSLVADIAETVNKLKHFGERFFANVYTRAPWEITPCSSNAFISQAGDRSMLNAALSYNNIVRGKNALPLDVFFAPIESGEVAVPPERYVDLFEHSFMSLVIDDKLNRLGSRRNGLGKNADIAVDNFIDAEAELCECNAARIESLCMARINADDDDFDFLAVDKGINMSLRKMFKLYSNAIIKLKRCFILSPSTASVLFRGEAYENFDVVIVDEASQMEPVDVLPVLFRSKQCVLVGDEFQMPPLAHFKAKNRRRISDENSELTVDTDISALSLALGNLAFDAEELVCHYRSKTETLIEFSQREFYPYMRTFPATVPASPDLGFTDVLTAEGYCEDGVNRAEAAAAVKALNAHFDRYYNNDAGTLGASVGVVTFGEAQLKHVLSLVRADKALSGKIDTALRNFDDVPDKLIFFRTIESVQGQETDHLILSITYGRDKAGRIKLAFGELNRDATGKNIFNVAVTRAKSRVTVIHSLTSAQMAGNARIAFIRSYLADVERYAGMGTHGFLTKTPEKGGNFVRAVADYVIGLGVSPERVVTDYGITDGSIRMPIAVLNKDLNAAQLGIWCEYPVQKKYDGLDYNVRYFNTLIERGWTLHRVYIHDYFDNAEAEKAALKAAVQKHVTM